MDDTDLTGARRAIVHLYNSVAPVFRKVVFGSTPRAQPAKEATPDGDPLTVFIDGPSGFTFVWDREGGWKFVGKIVDKGR
jgi:hypothetical protein